MGLAESLQSEPNAQNSPAADAGKPDTRVQSVAIASAQAQAPEKSSGDDFRPYLAPHNQQKKSPALSAARLNLSLSSFFTYYPMLRWAGYVGEATTSRMSKMMERKYNDELKDAVLSKPERLTDIKGQFNYFIKKVGDEGKKDYFTGSTDFMRPLAKVEAVGFTGLAGVFATKEYANLKKNCGLAVAAERGKDEKDISFMDLCGSNNPIVTSAVDRFIWQSASRAGAGMSFFGGLLPGILGNTALFTLERTVFYRMIAYDQLSKVVTDVQLNRLGQEAKPELVDGLIRTMQAARTDHRRPLLEKNEIDELRPVLNNIADDIINRDFGLRGVMYLMGGGVLIPGDPQQSMKNYQHVRDLGVNGVAQEGKWIRQQTGAKANQTWQMTLRLQRDKDYIAESAREGALRDQQDEINTRGPLHAGVYRDGMRGGDRSGTGIAM